MIHPSQVPILNEGFGPSVEELAWAARVVAAADRAGAAGEGAFRLDDRMIDRPVLLRARRWLAMAGRGG